MVGRKKEIKELEALYVSNEAEFVAIYGRRRIGKTYLVDETFKDRITFRHAGLAPAENDRPSPLKAQLQAFYYSLLQQGMEKGHCPKNWLEAFFMLEQLLESKNDGSRQLVFLDELPWMDTARSGFVTALEGFWNAWACHRKNMMLVVCGSANSWILDRLINNHGGLYNRITHEIKLTPFTLKECEDCLQSRNIQLSRYDITQVYMILGGVPYYLNYLQNGKSLAQNIDELFFCRSAKFFGEYNRLFSSAFSKPDAVKQIVECLARRSKGFTRDEISDQTGIPSGGMLTELLDALIASDFVDKYVPFGQVKKQHYYKLIDPFCLFYNKFSKDKNNGIENYWSENQNSQNIISWKGYAFENVCFNHIRQIKSALGISGISSVQSAWSGFDENQNGTQIDMLIERRDNVVNMCEMKFYGDLFAVDKDYDMVLRRRQGLLYKQLSPKQTIYNTLITTFGLKHNQYSGDFTNVINLDDLFS